MNISVKSRFLSTRAEISVKAKALKNTTVVRNLLGLNIILHWRLNPIMNPEPAIEITIEREKQSAKVSGWPVRIFSTENQASMSRTMLIQTHVPKAMSRSVIESEGKNDPVVSSCSLDDTGK